MYLLIHLPSIHLSILVHLFIYPSSIYPSMHHPSISISTSIYPCSIHLSILVHLFIYALSIYPLVCLFIYASSIYPLVHLFIYPSSIYPCISISTSMYLCIIHYPSTHSPQAVGTYDHTPWRQTSFHHKPPPSLELCGFAISPAPPKGGGRRVSHMLSGRSHINRYIHI